MSTPRTIRTVALLVGFLPVGQLAAQTPLAAQAPAGCTYATCALRVEQSFFSGTRLLRGASGERVSRLGGFGGGADLLLEGPDSVATHARSYVSATRRSTTLGLLGTAAYVVVLVRTDNFRDDFDDASIATAIAGSAFGIAAIPFALKAKRELSRAVWWYNGGLAR